MPVVQMEDGTELEFPESMSREEMRSAILSKYPSSTDAEPSETEKAAKSLAETRGLIRDTTQIQQEQARKEGDRATTLYGLANAGQTALDVLSRTRPDFALKSARDLAQSGVGKLLDFIPGIPKRNPEAPTPRVLPPEMVKAGREALNNLLPTPQMPDWIQAKENPIDEATGKVVDEMISGMAEPENAMAMGPVMKYPELARPLFQLPMIGEIPQATEEVINARTPAERAGAALKLGATAAFPALIEHRLRTPPRMPEGTVIPESKPRAIPFPQEAAVTEEIAKLEADPHVTGKSIAGLNPDGTPKFQDEIIDKGKVQRLADLKDGTAEPAAKAVGEPSPSQAEISPPAETPKVETEAQTPEHFAVVDEMVRNGERSPAIAKRLLEMGLDRETILKTIQDRVTPNFGNPELDSVINEEQPPAPTKPVAEMEDRFKVQAQKDVGDNPTRLGRELRGARSLLTDEAKRQFGKGKEDLANNRIVSDDGKLGLVWRNTGKTSRGSISLERIEEPKPAEAKAQGEVTAPAAKVQAQVSKVQAEAKARGQVDAALKIEQPEPPKAGTTETPLEKMKREKAEAAEAKLTPMMRQYRELKKQQPPGLLAVRLGDFYEFFFDDAVQASKALNIALTKRVDTPMAGVPFHSANKYFTQLSEMGHEVHVVDNISTGKVETFPKAGAEGEIIGMGGAVPGEFETNPKTATGIKNATVEQERAQRGLPPAMQPLRRDFGQVWDRAMAVIDRDPMAQDRLIESLRDKPRSITDEEDALLLHRQVDLQNEYGKATRDLAQAHDDGRTDDVAREKLRVAELSDRLLDLYNINKKAGTETARGLAARKMMAYEDFTLAKMEMDRRAVRGGASLTDAERGEIARLQKQIEDSQKAFDEYKQQQDQRGAELESRAVIAEMGKQAAERRLTAPVLAAAERVVKTLHTRADAARVRLKERLKRTSAGIDPTILLDVAEIGAEHLANIGYDFAKWSAKMVEDVGDWVQEHLPKIWEASQKVVDNLDLNATIKAQIKRGVPPSIEDVTARIGQKMKDGALDSVTGDVQKLVRRFAEEGVRDMNTMIDKVWEVLKGVDPEITRREAMDAISGYGKFKQLTKDEISVRVRDLKGQMQQVAKLEDMQAGQAPLKTGVERRTPSDEERQLLKLVNEAKKKGGFSVTNPELQLASALQARKTYYRNRLSDLKQEIAKREKLVKQKSPVPTDAALDALKAEYAKVKAQHDDIFKQQVDALKAYKTRLQKQYAELQAKLAAKDYTTKPRLKLELDPEAMRLKARNERLKDQWLQEQAAERMKNRNWWEKVFDWGALYRRAGVLSSPLVIPKLISAGLQRLASLPLEDLAGEGLRRVPGVSGIAKHAPLEGAGLNLKSEVTGWKNAFTTGMKDAYNVLKTGKSDLDVIYGHGENYTGESEFGGRILTFFGRLHGMLKAPVKRAVFERSVERLGEYYQKNKLDLTDDLLKTRIGLEAYQAANRAIFLQDNFVASKVSQFLSEKTSKETGHATIGSKAWATAGRVALPIVKVPTNIVAETLQYAAGLGSGGTRVAFALAKGVEKLTPAQSDLIMRELKKGSIGFAVLALGYFSPNVIGGYYQPGQKRKAGDVKAGRIKVYGHEIPSWLLHNPLLETLQIGATVRRVADAKLRKKDSDPQGIGAGLLAGAVGVVEEAPFVREMVELDKLHDPTKRGQFLNEQAKSMLIPSLVQKTAEWTDSAVKRKPHTLGQTLETGIPGLRGNVPTN